MHNEYMLCMPFIFIFSFMLAWDVQLELHSYVNKARRGWEGTKEFITIDHTDHNFFL